MKSNYLFSLFSLLALGCLNSAIAQNSSCSSKATMQTQNTFTTITSSLINTSATATAYKNVSGSPYLVTSYEKSKVYVDNKLLGTYYTRYNVYRKEIEVKKTALKEELAQTLSRDGSIKVIYNDKTLQFTTFLNKKGEKQYDYLMAVADGEKYTLYKRVQIKYRKGRKAEDSYQRDTQDRFSSSNEYYLKDSKTNLVLQLPSKKSSLLEIFNNTDKIQVAGLIKKSSFKTHRVKDLTKLFNFVNTKPADYAAK